MDALPQQLAYRRRQDRTQDSKQDSKLRLLTHLHTIRILYPEPFCQGHYRCKQLVSSLRIDSGHCYDDQKLKKR